MRAPISVWASVLMPLPLSPHPPKISWFIYSLQVPFFRNVTFKGPFCNPNMLFLWYSSVDRPIDKISWFPNFQTILRLCWRWVMHVLLYRLVVQVTVGNYYVDIKNRQFDRLLCQTNEFAINILHTNIMYLQASADVKISTFLEKMGGWGYGSWNEPLKVSDLFWTTLYNVLTLLDPYLPALKRPTTSTLVTPIILCMSRFITLREPK